MEALPDIDHQIADVGAGQDLPEGDTAEELLLCHPGPACHDLPMNPARQAAPETEKSDLNTDAEQGQQPGRHAALDGLIGFHAARSLNCRGCSCPGACASVRGPSQPRSAYLRQG